MSSHAAVQAGPIYCVSLSGVLFDIANILSNDGVVPLYGSYPGCPQNANGLCGMGTVINVLQQRIAEIDFNYSCYGNYTASAGMNYNGLPPIQ
jgi:hypothetical protein